jgi:WD40 repeat protein
MGTVYRARDPILDRQVALKTISSGLLQNREARARFEREARAAARLQHPNIVTIYELGEVDGRLFIAMELIEGEDLAEAMLPRDRLSVTEKLKIIIDVCEGLDFGHKRGVFHRDVKPANVRLDARRHVKLVDFGIARLEDSTMTSSGAILGTPSYIAPEVLTGAPVDQRADMWAVGVMLFELLAGERPFDAPTIASLIYRIVHEPPPLLDASRLGLPQALTAVVERALAKNPAGRYRDLGELIAALQRVLGVAVTRVPLAEEARAAAFQAQLDEARRALRAEDFEQALAAGRRALGLEPGRTEALQLVEEAERRLQDAPTADVGGSAARAAAAATATSAPPTIEVHDALPGERRPTTSQVLTQLKLKGAGAFAERALFGGPPGTQSACLSPRADLLAVAGVDGAIRFWDVAARTCTLTLRTELHQRTGHDALALALAFSPDGDLLASAHVDGGVHLWDLARGSEVKARLRHDTMASAVAFSPDGRVLASGGMDSTLKLWDVGAARAGEARRELHRQPAGVSALCYSRDGRTLVSGHANRALRVLDPLTGRLLASLWGPEGKITLLTLHPDGRHLAVASQDRTLRLFDLEARSQALALPPQRRAPTGLGFFPGGQHLATVAQDNAVQLWDLAAGNPTASLWGQQDEAFSGLAIFAGGDHIAVALADGRIRLWGPAA